MLTVGREAAIASLHAEWDALLAASEASTFNAWEWLYPWAWRIAPERRPWVLTARSEDRKLVGLLPLALEQRRVAGRPVRRLAFLGETHVGSDDLGVVALPAAEREVSEAFAHELWLARGEWDLLDLFDMASGSMLLDAVQAKFPVTSVEDRFVCPSEGFAPGDTFDGFLRRTSRRDNFLRRKKWFERQSGYSLDVVKEPERVPRALADFFKLHAMRWAAEGGSQGIKGWGVEAFHRDAAQLLAQAGKLRLFTMRLQGAALASVYGIFDRGRFLYYQSGYDPAWRHKSAGLVLVGETFRSAIEEGATTYDFLRGTEPYKFDWTTRRRRTVALRVWQPGPGAWLVGAERLGAKARNVVKEVLPQQWVEQIRRARRRQAALTPDE